MPQQAHLLYTGYKPAEVKLVDLSCPANRFKCKEKQIKTRYPHRDERLSLSTRRPLLAQPFPYLAGREAASQPTDATCQRKPTLRRDRETEMEGKREFQVFMLRQSLFFLCRAAPSRRGPLKSSLLNYPDDVRETLSWLQVPL